MLVCYGMPTLHFPEYPNVVKWDLNSEFSMAVSACRLQWNSPRIRWLPAASWKKQLLCLKFSLYPCEMKVVTQVTMCGLKGREGALYKYRKVSNIANKIHCRQLLFRYNFIHSELGKVNLLVPWAMVPILSLSSALRCRNQDSSLCVTPFSPPLVQSRFSLLLDRRWSRCRAFTSSKLTHFLLMESIWWNERCTICLQITFMKMWYYIKEGGNSRRGSSKIPREQQNSSVPKEEACQRSDRLAVLMMAAEVCSEESPYEELTSLTEHAGWRGMQWSTPPPLGLRSKNQSGSQFKMSNPHAPEKVGLYDISASKSELKSSRKTQKFNQWFWLSLGSWFNPLRNITLWFTIV